MNKITERHTINVFQRHIDHGIAKDCGKCPLALAIEEMTGTPCQVGVEHVFVFQPGRPYMNGELVEEAQNFVYRFDHKMLVGPISFPLALEGYQE